MTHGAVIAREYGVPAVASPIWVAFATCCPAMARPSLLSVVCRRARMSSETGAVAMRWKSLLCSSAVTALVASSFALAGAPASSAATMGLFHWGASPENTSGSSAPVAVPGLATAMALAVGDSSDYVVLGDGSVMARGGNGDGQLGGGTGTGTGSGFVKIPGLGQAVSVASGASTAYALLQDGTVWAWGRGIDGELGNGSSVSSSVPVRVTGLTGVTAITAKRRTAYALLSNGTIRSWGSNETGALGNGTAATSPVPVAVSGASGVRRISANSFGGFALTTAGTVLGWGANDYGQLGTGFTAARSNAAVPVAGLSGVTGVASTGRTGYALQSNGTVRAWGEAEAGSLGSGTFDGSFTRTPVAVSGLTGVVDVTGGQYNGYAVRSDGSAWAWGDDTQGNLGDGGAFQRGSNVPVRVAGLSGVTKIASGGWGDTLAIAASTTPSPTPSVTPSISPTPMPTPVPTPAPRYVALGDSFGSGEGAAENTFQVGTSFGDPVAQGATVGCHRSTTSWAFKVAAQAATSGLATDFKFVACSGGVVDDLYTDNAKWVQYGAAKESAQLASLSQYTKLATLSIGGNDVGFEKILNDCAQSVTSIWGANGFGCRNTGRVARTAADNGLASLTKGIVLERAGLTKRLGQVYVDAVVKMAPGSKLIVTGYPKLFAESKFGYGFNKESGTTLACKVGTVSTISGVFISYADGQWLNTVAARANAAISSEVSLANTTLRNSGKTMTVQYAPSSGEFTDHRICSGDKWINGVQLTSVTAPQVPSPKRTSFHPNQAGQDAYARAVLPFVK